MDRLTKVLLWVSVGMALLLATAMYVTASVTHRIETLLIDVKGLRGNDATTIVITHSNYSRPPFRETTFERVLYGDGVIQLTDIPEGSYSVRLPTDACKHVSPTLAQRPGNLNGIYDTGFSVSDTRRWIRLQSVVFLIDLWSCKSDLHSFRPRGWKWGF